MMDMFSSWFGSEVFTWVVLPILIFLARILDQSIGTVRLIFLSKGFRLLAPVLGFFEVIIWLLAVGQIMQHLDNFMCYIAYGAGFAMGNYLGIIIEGKLSLGHVLIRVILKKENQNLIEGLKAQNFGITLVEAEGGRGSVVILLSIIKRRDTVQFISIIDKNEPDAFYTIEEIKSSKDGVFRKHSPKTVFDSLPFHLKKSK